MPTSLPLARMHIRPIISPLGSARAVFLAMLTYGAA